MIKLPRELLLCLLYKGAEYGLLIGLVRHGKTDWNEQGKIQGQTDIPLNEVGIVQAKALAERLSREDQIWDAVISSDLQRAHATAQIIASKLNIPLLESEPRLRERYFGEVEGTKEQERHERWGTNWREIAEGVESNDEVRARGLSAINEWKLKYPKRNLLVVSHGSFWLKSWKRYVRVLRINIYPTCLILSWSCEMRNGIPSCIIARSI